ncbi:hypothetical protein FNV43_RR24608 [Rhamnella rubrinervis]|uniref:Tf2-1-like SH3-like domain-containing protein n=1 Tax=Rhamnella rubrinervis TaxID=2594499 RepID=A0A8K0DN36_9ROSA|nr:hypothetical protein FNV43_RR24608 [Rhamnella rubrinervis]
MDIDLVPNQYSYILSTLTIQPSIVDNIKEGQVSDSVLSKIKNKVIQEKRLEFNFAGGGILKFGIRLCVPNVKEILMEAHCTYDLLDREVGLAVRSTYNFMFEVGEKMFLMVASLKGVTRFGLKGKLSPCYIRPFKILERIGALAYRLALPPNLASIHGIFYVSMLYKYIHNPSHVIEYEPLEVFENFMYMEKPMKILNKKDQINGVIASYKLVDRCVGLSGTSSTYAIPLKVESSSLSKKVSSLPYLTVKMYDFGLFTNFAALNWKHLKGPYHSVGHYVNQLGHYERPAEHCATLQYSCGILFVKVTGREFQGLEGGDLSPHLSVEEASYSDTIACVLKHENYGFRQVAPNVFTEKLVKALHLLVKELFSSQHHKSSILYDRSTLWNHEIPLNPALFDEISAKLDTFQPIKR